MQGAPKPFPDLLKVPLAISFAKTDEARELIEVGIHSPGTQILEGNLPDFLRKLKPIQLAHRFESQRTTTATIFVMPDYLAIGSDTDFLLMPMNLHTATHIVSQFGFTLPTKKIVDAIFSQSFFHLTPEPMPSGPQMSSTQYYVNHNRKIREQRLSLGCSLDALISGTKKDVVLTNRLAQAFGKIAIYGWHRLSGTPIQPLTTVHGASYADYSHGIRLVIVKGSHKLPSADFLELPVFIHDG